MTNDAFVIVLEKAKNGDAQAQYEAGMHLLSRSGLRPIERSDAEAAEKFFKMAADQGHAEASGAYRAVYEKLHPGFGHFVLKMLFGRAIR